MPRLGFIAWVVPLPTLLEVEAIKKKIFLQFGPKQTLKAPAHLTLIPPQNLPLPLEKNIKEKLNELNDCFQPFPLTISGVDHFKNRTIYLKVSQDSLENIKTIRNTLLVSLASEFDCFNQGFKKETFPFKPHISLANRDIPSEKFKNIFNFCQRLNYQKKIFFKRMDLLFWQKHKWNIKS